MKTKAFSMLELLVVIAMFLTLLSAVVVGMLRLFFSNQIDIASQELAHTLRRANSLATSQVYDSAWGVQFVASDDSYILFSGTGYYSRETSRDEVFQLPDSVTYESLSLFGSASGIVFNQGAGTTGQFGSVNLLDSEGVEVTIRVSILGSVNIQ